MKKFIAMLLALVMVLSLVACGDKKDDAAGTDDSDKDSQDTITLKMHFVDPETAPFVQGGKKIAELVSEATDGRIQIEVLAGGGRLPRQGLFLPGREGESRQRGGAQGRL